LEFQFAARNMALGAHSGNPQQVRDAIVAAATLNVVGNAGRGSPNRLLYSLIP
jgi:lactam utilization protein B